MYLQTTILVATFDLKGPSTQYTKLYELLQAQESWWHYLGQTWLIATKKTPRELSDEIQPLLVAGDFFLITRFSQEYWGWLPQKAWEWISGWAGQPPF